MEEFRKTNVEGTLRLAKQARDAGVKRFIYISSIKVNGDTTEINKPFQADDKPNPKGGYAVSKHEAEQGLIKISNKSGLKVVIIRTPLVYGTAVKANFHYLLKWLEFKATFLVVSKEFEDTIGAIIIRTVN